MFLDVVLEPMPTLAKLIMALKLRLEDLKKGSKTGSCGYSMV